MSEYLYLATFFSWIPLALLAGTQRGRPAARVLRTLGVITFLFCGYLLYLEFIWSRTVVAPIRVDLLLLIPVATVTFIGVGLWGLFRPGGLPKIASLVLLALSLPTLVVFAQGIWKSSRNMVRLDARPALIFEAQFRNPQTFTRFFGNIESGDDPRAGNFRAGDAAGSPSRVIVNDEGHLWVLASCGTKVECVRWQADLGQTARALPATFQATPEYGPPVQIAVSGWSRERLTLEFAPSRSFTFVRTPVSYLETVPGPRTVTYHGSFSETRIDRDAIYLVQIWLWQSGDRWLAYYVRQPFRCGSTNDFISASAYGGKPFLDQVYFTSATGDQKIEEFHVKAPTPADDRLDGEIVWAGSPLQPIAARKQSVLRAPLYESAPLGDMEATADWLKTVSMGYSLPWKAECAGR